MPYDVFISYAHEDQALCNELEEHLGYLQRIHLINLWYDSYILPGSEWRPQIMEHLEKDKIILLLISAHFMNSDFCYSIEMDRAIARHKARDAVVIPILLRPTFTEGAPFEELQMLPTGKKPVVEWPTHDAAFLDIVKGIRRQIEALEKATKKGP